MRQLLKARCWVLPVLLFMTMNACAVDLPRHPYLVVSAAKTGCGLLPHSKIILAELDAVIDKVIADGILKRLLDACRQSLRK